MNLLTGEIANNIQRTIINPTIKKDYGDAIHQINLIQRELYTNIPENLRISYGRVYTVKVLAEYLFQNLVEQDAPVLDIATNIYEKSLEGLTKGVALGILSFYGLGNYEPVIPFFESAAAADNWDVRELAQMFFRKLIKKYPGEAK